MTTNTLPTTRIAIVVPALTGGGAEGVAVAWAAALDRRGFGVDLLLTHSGAGTHDSARVTSVGRESQGIVKRIWNLRRQLASNKYSTVFSVMTFSNILTLLAAATLPAALRPRIVISEHNLHTRLATIYGPKFKLQMMLCRLLYRRASAWVAVSHAVASEMSAIYKLPLESMWIVLNPMLRSDHETKARRAISDVEGTELKLVFAGRLVKQKNPRLLIEIARLAKLDGKISTIHYIGDGPLMESLRSECQQANVNYKFHGWVDDWTVQSVPGSVLVLSSFFEGLGNVLIEAAFAGIPAVLSDRTLGAADACIPGITACISPDYTPESFYEAVCEAQQLVPVDIQNWLSQFSLDNAGKTLAMIVQSDTTEN